MRFLLSFVRLTFVPETAGSNGRRAPERLGDFFTGLRGRALSRHMQEDLGLRLHDAPTTPHLPTVF